MQYIMSHLSCAPLQFVLDGIETLVTRGSGTPRSLPVCGRTSLMQGRGCFFDMEGLVTT